MLKNIARALVVLGIVGAVVADRRNGAPSNGYGAPPAPTNGYGAPSKPRNGYGAPPKPSNSYGPPNGGYGGYEDPLAALAESIPGGGIPGEDYPILASVPDTGFDCDFQTVPGYYADTDPEAGCQVFHICQDRALRRQKDSFLCPNGTIFNQQYLVCDWWFNFDCSTAEDFYSVNELIGVVPYGKPKTNGYGSNGNGNGGYQSNGNGKRNGRKNGKSNGRKNGTNGGYGAPAVPSSGYGAPSAPSNAYGAPF
ncbi:hypothetical protein SK128_023726 [Halocaridina rubra]|uniref:Chitin-binding type-2 domain-containing protein n=1 Tax=Halocaridina rubra TaxID=373956 RepID=A0AAN8X185_HALRR